MRKIGVIGGGNMGEAIISSVRKKYSVQAAEKDKSRCAHLRLKYKLPIRDLRTVVCSSEVIILAVKPQDFEEVLAEIAQGIDKKQLIISIAAGIRTDFIEKKLGKKLKVIRTMPNLPATIKQGMTAICRGRYATEDDLKKAAKIFSYLGKTVIVKEELMDTITAVSGSGPGYVFYFIECMIKAACNLGIKEELAKELVETTFLGSVHLLVEQKIDAGILRARVTSKGGTTAAALETFNKNNFEQIMAQALRAAQKRAGELSRR